MLQTTVTIDCPACGARTRALAGTVAMCPMCGADIPCSVDELERPEPRDDAPGRQPTWGDEVVGTAIAFGHVLWGLGLFVIPTATVLWIIFRVMGV